MPKKTGRKPVHRVARKAKRGGGSNEGKSGYRVKREQQLAQDKKKSGCAPKLFMLLLPFAAIGTYLVLKT